jgi:hypothetical protein
MGMFTDVGGVPVVSASTGHDGGFGGNWIFALVIIFFALVFFRGGAFGGERHGEGGAPAAAAFTEINGRFNALEQSVGHIEDLAALRAIQASQCETNQNILRNGFELSKEILINSNVTQRQLAECCCTTQRGIDKLAYEGASNTCQIITNANENTGKILVELKNAEITALRDKLAERDLQLSQCNQNATLIAALKPPCPVPAYPTCNPNWPSPGYYGFAGAPVAGFGGGGCCGGNGFANGFAA